MKVTLAVVCITLLVTSAHAFLSSDSIASFALLNSMSGGRRGGLSGLFGGRMPMAGNTVVQGQGAGAGRAYNPFGGLFGSMMLMEGI